MLDGAAAIPLRSGTRVSAYGARFRLPNLWVDRARIVLFEGTDLTEFEWLGGSFHGNVFDPTRDATWQPNANTRCILIQTTAAGRTKDLRFRDIRSDGIAGAVVTVLGAAKPGSDREVENLRFQHNARKLRPASKWQVYVGLRLPLADYCLAGTTFGARASHGSDLFSS